MATVCAQRGWEALKAISWSIQKPQEPEISHAGRSGRIKKKALGCHCRGGAQEGSWDELQIPDRVFKLLILPGARYDGVIYRKTV
jgi:hypothetical protein